MEYVYIGLPYIGCALMGALAGYSVVKLLIWKGYI
jgi:hypothetical protein